MISVAFVNGESAKLLASDPFLLLEQAMINADNEIEEAVSSFMNTSENIMFESELMGELDSEKSLFLEAEGNNIFEKIGQKVIEIFQKFMDILKGIKQKFKDMRFKSKGVTDKVDAYCKGDPSLKDKVICAFSQSDLKIADMKSLKEMDDAYQEILNLSKKKDVDPKSLRGKVEAMKKKFEGADKSAIVQGAKAATIIVTAAGLGYEFKKRVLDADKATSDKEKRVTEKREKTLHAYDELKKRENGKYVDPNGLTKAQILQNLFFWYSNQCGKMVAAEQGNITKMEKGALSFLSKYAKDKSSKEINDLENSSKVLKSKEKKAEKDEREKERKLSKARAVGTAMGKDSYDKHHPEVRTAERRKTKEDTKDRLKAELDFKAKNKTAYDSQARHTAKAQTEGREAGSTPKSGTQKVDVYNHYPDNKKNNNNGKKNNP